jgi:hypothetical protein
VGVRVIDATTGKRGWPDVLARFVTRSRNGPNASKRLPDVEVLYLRARTMARVALSRMLAFTGGDRDGAGRAVPPAPICFARGLGGWAPELFPALGPGVPSRRGERALLNEMIAHEVGPSHLSREHPFSLHTSTVVGKRNVEALAEIHRILSRFGPDEMVFNAMQPLGWPGLGGREVPGRALRGRGARLRAAPR